MAKVEMQPQGRFGTALYKALQAKNMSVRDIAAKMDMTYEHMRKLLKGMAYPSKHLTKAMAPVLGLNAYELEHLVKADKLDRTYGVDAAERFGRNAELDEIDKFWKYLTDDQKQSVYVMVRSWAKSNRTA